MELTVISETDEVVRLSNGDEVYQCIGVCKGKWGISTKKARDDADSYEQSTAGHGVFCNSWILQATNKKDALTDYQSKTGNHIKP